MIYAISDIHGHQDVLEEALEHTDLSGENKLVLRGDYIDGGPQSGQVLRFIRELQRRNGPEKVIALQGNHEMDFLEWLDIYGGPNAGQTDEYGLYRWSGWLDYDEGFQTFRTLITPEQWTFFVKVMPTLSDDSLNMEAAQLVLSADRELITWLRGLPLFYETDRQIFVHAGIDEEAGEWWPWATPEHVFVGKFPASTGRFYKDIIAGHVSAAALSGDREYNGVFFDGQSHYYIDGGLQNGGRLNVLAWDEENGYRQWDNGWKEI